jgi:hypothetical protein
MAGRNAPSKPAEPKPVKTHPHPRHPHQSKAEYESVAAVNSRKTEKDVTKLIDCLAEWTRDLRAARSAAPPVRSSRSRSSSHARRVVSSASLTPSYPRGNPLTESMEFTDRAGTVWLAYIEGARPAPRKPRKSAILLPGRHLRFDSATESRFTSRVPAGSPFLAKARLQSLLDEAEPDVPSHSTAASARSLSSPGHRVVQWSTRAVESGREAIGDCSRRWQETASRRQALRRQMLELLSGAANTMYGTRAGSEGRAGAD